MNIEQIAILCHQTNKLYCEMLGDYSQKNWDGAEEWQKLSAINGVKTRLDNPNGLASCCHEAWLKEKIDSGWVYGPIKDSDKKEHPCCVSYNQLPIEQQIKDKLFISIVDATSSLLNQSSHI